MKLSGIFIAFFIIGIVVTFVSFIIYRTPSIERPTYYWRSHQPHVNSATSLPLVVKTSHHFNVHNQSINPIWNNRLFIDSVRYYTNARSFQILDKNKTFLTDPPSLKLSQNYDNILGKTLHNLLHHESKNYTSFNSSMLKHIFPVVNHRVPSLLHYILFYGNGKMDFHHMVCILSGFWILQPQYMILWYNHELAGPHWDYLKSNLSSQAHRVVLLPIKGPRKVYGKNLAFVEHQADVARLEILHEFGGIYLDHDVVVVKSFEPFYKFPFTIGKELPQYLCNAVMLAERESMFIHIWHAYYQYYSSDWNLLSVQLPHSLYTYFTRLFQWKNLTNADRDKRVIHVEEESLERPNWIEAAWIYDAKRVWNWKEKNYAVHLWFRMRHRYLNWTTVETENSMYGDLFRYILWGNTAAVTDK